MYTVRTKKETFDIFRKSLIKVSESKYIQLMNIFSLIRNNFYKTDVTIVLKTFYS